MAESVRELLENNLQEYKTITERLIEDISNDLEDNISELISKRQALIEDMKKLQYSKEEFTLICNRLNIISLSKGLEDLIIMKMSQLREKMNRLSNKNMANNSYVKNTNVKRSFFTTEI